MKHIGTTSIAAVTSVKPQKWPARMLPSNGNPSTNSATIRANTGTNTSSASSTRMATM